MGFWQFVKCDGFWGFFSLDSAILGFFCVRFCDFVFFVLDSATRAKIAESALTPSLRDSAFLCEILRNYYAVIARFCVSRIVAIYCFVILSEQSERRISI
ncbi:hypothetical protein ACWIUD_05025 [Helicobacter sp. 23-1044]